MRRKYFIYSLIAAFLLSFWQVAPASENPEINALLTRLSETQHDTSRIKILLKLAEKSGWSDIKESEKYSKEALKLSQKNNYIKGMAYAKFQLASVFIDFDFKLTEELILESLEQAREIGDSILIARCYNIIGNLKDILKHPNDALTFYNQSLQIYKLFGQDSLAAGIYNNLGIVYRSLAVDSLSEVYYLKAAEINLRTENFLWLAINYLNLGETKVSLGSLEKGLDYLEKSLEIARSYEFQRLLPWIYNNISNYHLAKREFAAAIRYAGMGLEIARSQSNRLQERESLRHLRDASFGKQDYLNAYKYSEEINTVSDSINSYNQLIQLDMLEMRYKFDEERKQQRLESELLKAEIDRKELTNIMIIFGSGLLVFVFVLLYLVQRNRIRRKSLEQKATLLEKENLSKELEYKNKELTTNVMYLLRKNEFISRISDKLKNTTLDPPDGRNEVLDKIISELDRSISDDAWTDFEVRFQEVHVDFYNQLSKKFPDLTPNELRLCAFLRLNMTSKEISSITYQSIESLKAARYRLRKKLGMDRDENLIAFLAQL